MASRKSGDGIDAGGGGGDGGDEAKSEGGDGGYGPDVKAEAGDGGDAKADAKADEAKGGDGRRSQGRRWPQHPDRSAATRSLPTTGGDADGGNGGDTEG